MAMVNRSILIAAAILGSVLAVAGQKKTVHVDSYTRKDGTVVRSYDRSCSGCGNSSPTSSGASTYRIDPPATVPVVRDDHGRIKRSAAARDAFKRLNVCPSTHLPSGSCHGFIIDHIIPLACGGPDDPSNMQWQTVAEAAAKDKVERIGCRATPVGRFLGSTALTSITTVPSPPDYTAGIIITSLPSGASVSIDGVSIGATPTTPLAISEGSHAVIVRMFGYAPWGGELIFEAGQTVHAVLEKDLSKPQTRR